VRGLVLVAVVLLGGGLVVVLMGGDLDTVSRTVESSGAWGPLVYVALHVVLTLVPVPKNLLATIAGALFGMTSGLVLSWVGSVVAAVVGFALARRLGRAAVSRLSGRRIDRVGRLLERQGLLAEVVARLTPFVPFTVVNYGSGLSPMRWRDYVAGTAVGVVPGTVTYVAVGASAGRDLTTIVAAAGVGAVLLAAPARPRQPRSH
jgi:uncharacterized membrane protein YdjX (TVP38/TMEM64 family)